MSVVAKFKCIKKIQTENGTEVVMKPVTGDSPENKEFFKWTPFGELNMGTVNENVSKQFEVGKEYYLTFEETEEK